MTDQQATEERDDHTYTLRMPIRMLKLFIQAFEFYRDRLKAEQAAILAEPLLARV